MKIHFPYMKLEVTPYGLMLCKSVQVHVFMYHYTITILLLQKLNRNILTLTAVDGCQFVQLHVISLIHSRLFSTSFFSSFFLVFPLDFLLSARRNTKMQALFPTVCQVKEQVPLCTYKNDIKINNIYLTPCLM